MTDGPAVCAPHAFYTHAEFDKQKVTMESQLANALAAQERLMSEKARMEQRAQEDEEKAQVGGWAAGWEGGWVGGLLGGRPPPM